MAMTAMTRSTWMMLPTLNTKAPKSHPIMRMIAITYNRSLMTMFLKNAGQKAMPMGGINRWSTLWSLTAQVNRIQLLNVEFITEYVDTLNP
jgi:hypothetical protein